MGIPYVINACFLAQLPAMVTLPALMLKMTRKIRKPNEAIGYVRVSALDSKKLRPLKGVKLDKKFIDKNISKDMKQFQLEQLLSYVRKGDTVLCHSMGHLARNLDDLCKLVLSLTERGVHIRFEKENLSFTGGDSSMTSLLLGVMGAFAQFERDIRRERQQEGIACAKLRPGTYVGRKPCMTPARVAALRRRVARGESKTALALEFNIARQTLYRYLNKSTAGK